MTLQIETNNEQKTICNVTIVRKPTTDEDTNYNFVCIDTFNQKRYFNNIVMIRG